ncbi:carboxymuconolactone decarboxylase family protein [Fervidibacillus albus]|uniref:Carboxymuconolactone decarboxylase family protein n=1 Tax=Fervidibacillus albus TaxID=2980026 RepID=A0A9E8RWY5_9BACI|nr:carboxymuconolactone decarboxylase family protein [Fervidibacillus albus]WAA11176.1 carboxymuconolactone decarboxylase family protein [Fervidibacillus albus]
MTDIHGENPTEYALLEYKKGMGIFTKKMPELAKHYHAYTEACFKDGALTEREKQLIALGISLYSGDEYCIIYHTKGCLDNGCDEKQILEIAGVASVFGGGASMSQTVTLLQQSISDFNTNRH